MKKNILANILLHASLALLTAPFTTRAIASITMEVETGAQVDKATAIVKNIKEDEQVVVPQFKDTNFLFTGEPMSSLVIYNTAASGGFFMVTGVGDSVVEISAENIGEGDFVVVNTTEPDGCTTLTLAECRANAGFLNEKSFSISLDGEVPAPTIDIIDSGVVDLVPETKSGFLDTVSGFFLGLIGVDNNPATTTTPVDNTAPISSQEPTADSNIPASTIDIIDSGATPAAPLPDSAPVDSTSTPEATPAPVIQQSEDGSTTIIAI